MPDELLDQRDTDFVRDNLIFNYCLGDDDRLLIETDSPFLAPVPMRGNENEPSFLPHTLKFIAEQRKTSPEALALLTTDNARRILKC